MANAPKRRFVGLSVDEVSLVDSPANEKEFIVVKRLDQEDGEMADAVITEIQKADSGVESVPVEVAKATGEAIEKAMVQVSNLVENIVKTASAAKSTDGDGTIDADVEKGAGGLRKTVEAQYKAAGLTGDDLTKALEKFDTEAKKAFPFEKPKPGEKKTTKDGEGSETTTTTKDAGDGIEAPAEVTKMLETLETAIHKAKAFTPKREEALKSAIGQLTDLLKELSMQKIPTGDSPSTTVPKGVQYGASGVMDLTVKKLAELTDQVAKALGEMHDVQKSLGERVESIEKTREPSTSVDGDGGTDAISTEKSMWSGVL